MTRSTSLGFEAIEFADWVHERIAAVAAERDEPELLELAPRLMGWQRWLLIHALELLPGADQLFRFRIVLLLVARQNGKTTLMVYLILWRLFNDGARRIIGSAHTLDVAEETWEAVVAISEAIPELEEEIKKVSWGSGKRSLILEANEKYQVVPSTRGGGRSRTCDTAVLDELREHQTWVAWAAISKTTMARPRAQLYGVSNAGDASSIVLRVLRQKAHAALGNPDKIDVPEGEIPDDVATPDDDSIGIFEYSAAPGCAVQDRGGWVQANPALGYTITERAIASAAATDPEWVFRNEVMCQWNAGAAEGPFPAGAWESTLDKASARAPGVAVTAGVDVGVDRAMTSIAVAGHRSDGLLHGELIAQRVGTDWVQAWLAERVTAGTVSAIAGQGKGAPVSPLLDELEAAGLPVTRWQGPDLSAGTALFFDLVKSGRLRRRAQPPLDVAAATAVLKFTESGAMFWNRRQSPADVAPLVALNAAVWALLSAPKPTVSAYEDGELIIA